VLGFAISIVSGLATGAFFAGRSRPGEPTIDDYLFHRVAHPPHHISISVKSQATIPNKSAASGNDHWVLWIIGSLSAYLVATWLIGNYGATIVYVGWIVLTFFGTSAMSFAALSFYRDRRFSLINLWSLLTFAIVAYNLRVFSLSLVDPTYATHLESLQQSGLQAIEIDNLFGKALYQVFGLALSVVVMLFSFLQSLGVMFWPVAYRKRYVFRVFHICKGSMKWWIVVTQALFLVLAYYLLKV